MTYEQEVALARYERAVKLHHPPLGSSAPKSRRRAVEAEYGEAYQTLVRLGLRPQLKKKYRSL